MRNNGEQVQMDYSLMARDENNNNDSNNNWEQVQMDYSLMARDENNKNNILI